MLESLVVPDIKKRTFQFNDPEMSTNEQLSALEYLAIEKSIAGIKMLSLDESAIQYLEDNEFKEELSQNILQQGKVVVNINNKYMPLANKISVVQAYVHQEVERVLSSKETFELYVPDMDDYFPYAMEPFKTFVENMQKPQGHDYFYKAECLIESYLNLNKSFDGKETETGKKEAKRLNNLMQRLEKGEDPKEILYEGFPKIVSQMAFRFDEEQFKKNDLIRTLFRNKETDYIYLKEKGNNILEVSTKNYLAMTSEGKKEINQMALQNLSDMHVLQLGLRIQPQLLNKEEDFEELVKKSKDTINDAEKEKGALMPLQSIDTLLPVLHYELNQIEKRREKLLKTWQSKKELTKDNFYDLFPFIGSETKEEVYAAYKTCFPQGVKGRYDGDDQYHLGILGGFEETFYLTVEGTLHNATKMDEQIRSKKDPWTLTPEEHKKENEFWSIMLHENLDIDRNLEEVLKIMPPTLAIFEEKTVSGRVRIETDYYLSIRAVADIISETRSELDKKHTLTKLVARHLGDNPSIEVEEECMNLRYKSTGVYQVHTPENFYEKRELVSNGMYLISTNVNEYTNILGVSEHADEDQINKKFRVEVKKYHQDADKGKDNGEMLSKLKTARDALLDRQKSSYKGIHVNPFLGNLTEHMYEPMLEKAR